MDCVKWTNIALRRKEYACVYEKISIEDEHILIKVGYGEVGCIPCVLSSNR
jgi:hypothetical protein